MLHYYSLSMFQRYIRQVDMRTYLLTIALLLISTASLSTYSNFISNRPFTPDTMSILQLGQLEVGDDIKLTISFPNPTDSQPRNYFLILTNIDEQTSFVDPPGFTGLYNVPSDRTSVNEIEGTITTAANYHILIRPISAVDSIQVMQMKFSVNGVQKNVVDMPRSNTYRLIYLQSSKSVTLTTSSGGFDVYRMNSQLQILSRKYRGNLLQNFLYLQRGYYLIKLRVNSSVRQVRFSYQSDSYPCPFSSEYKDIVGTFEPCAPNKICPHGQIMVQGECICQKFRIRVDGKCQCKPPLSERSGNCVCPDDSPPDSNGNCIKKCPPGQSLVDGECVCLKPRVLIGKKCVCKPPLVQNQEENCECPPGQSQIKGKCQCKKYRIRINNECICQKPLQELNGNCICPNGTLPNKFGQCQCPPGSILIGNKCVCKKNRVQTKAGCICKPGFTEVKGECICNFGQVSPVTGNCISSFRCSFGFELMNGECTCPPGRQIVRGMCICPRGSVRRGGECARLD